MGGGAPALRVGRRMAFLRSSRKERNAKPYPVPPRESRCGGIVTSARNRNHILEYFGPPPPSGGTQVMLRLGSLISQVLQWTQFCALITKRGSPFSSTHS